MNQIGSAYGEALYDLAAEEHLEETILQQLLVLKQSFAQQPQFVQLLASPALSKAERCEILENSFSGKLEQYLLNFLMLLTEKNYIRYFPDCCNSYVQKYNHAHNILPVSAVTAVPLTPEQTARLTEKLAALTGKQIALDNRVDPACVGGVRLDYEGVQLDDTVAHRLEQVHRLLKNTVL